MARFCVNVGFLFVELPFVERFGAVRRAGFDGVEFAWPPIGHDELLAAVRDAGLRVAQINMDAGDLARGERGWASHPAQVERWRDAFDAGLELAARLDCPRINVLAGNAPPHSTRAELEECLADNLRWALPRAADAGRTLLMEMLNPTDTPAYLFTDVAATADFVRRIGARNLRLQWDSYHVAMSGAAAVAALRRAADVVGHVQLADVPGRHEPGTGKVDFDGIFDTLAELGYGGAIGLEYVPRTDTLAGLDWLPRAARGWSEVAWWPERGRR